MENTNLEKKNVFVSYCHKDVTEEWIDKLAAALGQYGINCIVDIYDLQLGQDLNYFMEKIKRVDKVLILLGKEYTERANNREAGVGTETQIITNDIYNDVEQTKFIPIVVNKDEKGEAYLPYYLEKRLYADLTNNSLFEEQIKEIVKHIHGYPKRAKPPVKFIKKEVFNDILNSTTLGHEEKSHASKNQPNINIVQNLWTNSPHFALVNDSDITLDYIPSPSYFLFIPSKLYFYFDDGRRFSNLALSPVSYEVVTEQIVTGSTKNIIVKSELPLNFRAKKGERDIIRGIPKKEDGFQIYVNTYPFLVIISEVHYSYFKKECKEILLSTPLQSIKIDDEIFMHVMEYLRDNYKHEVILPTDSSNIYEKANRQATEAFFNGGKDATLFGGKEGGYGFVLKEINRLISPADPMELQ